MRNHSVRRFVTVSALDMLLSMTASEAQSPPGQAGARDAQDGVRGARRARGATQPAAPSKPTPHWPDGRVNLSQAPGIKGFWNVAGGSPIGTGGTGLPTNLSLEQVPFQDWARALYEYRRSRGGLDDVGDARGE